MTLHIFLLLNVLAIYFDGIIYAHFIKTVLALNYGLAAEPLAVRKVGEGYGRALSDGSLGERSYCHPGSGVVCVDGGVGTCLDRLDKRAVGEPVDTAVAGTLIYALSPKGMVVLSAYLLTVTLYRLCHTLKEDGASLIVAGSLLD